MTLRERAIPGERCVAILPGQYFDAETGLHQNWMRDYDPETGRYYQPDPLGLYGGDLSIYTYAKQNPLRFTDPTGESAAVLPGPITIPAPGPAAALTAAAVAGYGAGSLLYPYVERPLANAIDKVCMDGTADCDREWEEAVRVCRKLIMEELEQRAGRKKKRSVRGVTGGFNDLMECARGLVSERCGGNKVSK